LHASAHHSAVAACRSDGASYSGQFSEGVMHGKGK
jgi:hypothetical protein